MALPQIFFDPISRFRQQETLPELDSLQAYIDYIVPQIRPFGEDLYEQDVYVGTSWLEFRDATDFNDTVVHFFREGREHMRSINGEIKRGSWELLEAGNYLILDANRNQVLYTLAFLNDDFFILKKHGNQSGIGKQKYLVLGREGAMRNRETGGYLTWREYAEALSNVYEQDNRLLITMAVIIVLLIFFIVWYM